MFSIRGPVQLANAVRWRGISASVRRNNAREILSTVKFCLAIAVAAFLVATMRANSPKSPPGPRFSSPRYHFVRNREPPRLIQ